MIDILFEDNFRGKQGSMTDISSLDYILLVLA